MLTQLITGCYSNIESEDSAQEPKTTLPTLSGDQLFDYLSSSDSPVLVEFGVDYNCPRCADNQSKVINLQKSLDGTVKVIRIDYNLNLALVNELGGTICPTYVLFNDRQPILTRSYPFSVDLIGERNLFRVGNLVVIRTRSLFGLRIRTRFLCVVLGNLPASRSACRKI